MERSKQECLNLLDETVTFYSEDVSRRAVNVLGGCEYRTKDGKNCAVGRCMTKATLENFAEDETTLLNAQSVHEFVLDEVLKDEYKGYNVDFWSHLQHLHDDDIFWDKDGLSEAGKNMVESIKDYIEKLN